jgi:hypothetical protein
MQTRRSTLGGSGRYLKSVVNLALQHMHASTFSFGIQCVLWWTAPRGQRPISIFCSMTDN